MNTKRYAIIIKQYGASKIVLFDKYEDALEYYDYCQEERLVCAFKTVEHIDVEGEGVTNDDL